MGTQANVTKIPFKLKGQIEKIFCRLLASPRLFTKWTDPLKMSGTSFSDLVDRAILVQISSNMLRVQYVDEYQSVSHTNFAPPRFFRYHDQASCRRLQCVAVCCSVLQCDDTGAKVMSPSSRYFVYTGMTWSKVV